MLQIMQWNVFFYGFSKVIVLYEEVWGESECLF